MKEKKLKDKKVLRKSSSENKTKIKTKSNTKKNIALGVSSVGVAGLSTALILTMKKNKKLLDEINKIRLDKNNCDKDSLDEINKLRSDNLKYKTHLNSFIGFEKKLSDTENKINKLEKEIIDYKVKVYNIAEEREELRKYIEENNMRRYL